MNKELILREAREQDLDFLAKLWLELMVHHENDSALFQVNHQEPSGIKEILLKKLENENTQIFLAENKMGILGFIVCFYQIGSEIFKLYKKGYIAETVISKPFRGQGIGRELYRKAENWLLEKKVDHIQLQVSVKNQSGIQFWTQQGFDKVTFVMNKEIK